MIAGRLTGYSQRFNFVQYNKWNKLGLDTNNYTNFLRDLIYFKCGLMPCQQEEMKKITEQTREYLNKYLSSQRNQVCYGVRQRAQTRPSRSIQMNTFIN